MPAVEAAMPVAGPQTPPSLTEWMADTRGELARLAAAYAPFPGRGHAADLRHRIATPERIADAGDVSATPARRAGDG